MRSHRRLLASSSSAARSHVVHWPKTLLVALALGACYAQDHLNFAGPSQLLKNQHSARTAAAGAEGGLRKMEDLCTGEELTGTVTKLKTAGATLDLGAGMQGFLHVRNLGEGQVEKASDFMAVGDTLQVRVLRIRKGEVDVALADFAAFQKRLFSDFAIGEQLQGTVVGVSKVGVFLDVGAVNAAFLAPENVLDFSMSALPELFKKGQKLVVKVAAIAPMQLDVSMK
ncbi:unnamed protein product [Polarella glacialis]|uniref:S1 motif domain-containing protein n=1 Tax=Polarella glacialis TaxID=89957 RepID=A0A813F8V6_POLGL|nr:unnamed protein product [Polarella glacialis]